MDKHYYSTQTSEEVKVGDKLIVTFKEKTSLGTRFIRDEIIITEDNIEDLMDIGFIEAKSDDPDVEMTIGYYIAIMAIRHGWSYKKMAGFLNKVFEINKVSALNMILKEIAIELDKKYKGHISQSDEIWVISTASGETVNFPKEKIASYNNFAAFRNSKDALIAWTIVKPLIMNMFTNDEEYKNVRLG